MLIEFIRNEKLKQRSVTESMKCNESNHLLWCCSTVKNWLFFEINGTSVAHTTSQHDPHYSQRQTTPYAFTFFFTQTHAQAIATSITHYILLYQSNTINSLLKGLDFNLMRLAHDPNRRRRKKNTQSEI